MIDVATLPKAEAEAVLARREYYRAWRAQNRDRVRQHNRNYWLRKAAKNGK